MYVSMYVCPYVCMYDGKQQVALATVLGVHRNAHLQGGGLGEGGQVYVDAPHCFLKKHEKAYVFQCFVYIDQSK